MKSYTNYIANTLTFGFVLFLSACGSGSINDLSPEVIEETPVVDSQGNYAGTVVIDMLPDNPKISRQPGGLTKLVMQFVPRDKSGLPLSSDQIEVELNINGESVNIESQLQSSSSELQFNVNFGLVLDTSYSMEARKALIPMLTAAKNSVQSGIDIWKTKESTFTFYSSWFNNYIYSSVDTINIPWKPEDILSIPTPDSNKNGFTKLRSAVDFMINRLNAIPLVEKPEGAPADQNIILVFSDGEDNYSWFDNSYEETETLYTNSGAEYLKMGYKIVSETELLENIKQSKNLTVHVVSLDGTVFEEILPRIAKAGDGSYQNNPNPDELVSVFDNVVSEFTTLQTHGASMPLPPGNYNFTLILKNKSGNLFTEYTFNFDTSEESASINPQ